MLRDLNLLPVYDSEQYDLIRDLQVPLLAHSRDYLRGVGFFTSGWLRLAAQGVVSFVEAGGKARVVVSPILEASDWEALKLGEAAKTNNVLRAILRRNIENLAKSLDKDTCNALAWMVADDVFEFRFAIPRDKETAGNYHDKVAVFTDVNGDQVVIHGSLNDSVVGSLNGEAFSVFKSWEPGQYAYVDMHRSRLEALWNDRNRKFHVCCIPEAIREEFIKLRSTSERPYRFPSVAVTGSGVLPHCNIELYDYQKLAIKKWNEAGHRGVFEMATGTGKTYTSLAAATQVFENHGRLAMIVLVPYLHLLEQWGRSCREFGFNPILCSSQHSRWEIAVRAAVQDFKLGVRSNICVLAVHKTASLDKFAAALRNLPLADTLLIGDEVHALGAPNLRSALLERAGMRLGLSATPRRWFDEEGTEAIFRYFGPVCFEYPLEQAIGNFLTPYEYYPQLVSLTDNEIDQYEELTHRILTIALAGKVDEDIKQKLLALLLERSRIIYAAQAKLPALLSLLRKIIAEHIQANEEPRGILIYCSPGHHKEVLQRVSGTGLRCHEFVHSVSLPEREKLLQQFASGDIQALIAIRCLDEGVDVPSTRMAFIMASSTNPREFVQRRGRILRLAPNKDRAMIYDFLVVPPLDRIDMRLRADLSVLQREMPRFVEYASLASNEFYARSTVSEILDKLGMLNLLEEKPWQVYHSLKGWDWYEDE
ncbi:MAG: DEAD/DEAH box helicase family protein [Bacillota bacterium]|nr:DEAD/DEAH box helicase family protein [Bacillota bacterium]